MPKKFNLGNVLLADYVGRGHNNKHILVNVYSGDMIVPAFPTDLALGIYAEILAAKDGTLPTDFEIAVVFNGEMILTAQAQGGDVSRAASVFMIPLFQMNVPAEGVLEIIISSPGYSKATALSKRIYAGALTSPLPTA